MPPELYAELSALFTVIVADLVLAGDNAVVVGMAAAGLSGHLRRKAIVFGIAAAAALRIIFALFATQLLNVVGLVLIGGLLLLWVSWKLWREIHAESRAAAALGAAALHNRLGEPSDDLPARRADAIAKAKTLPQALGQIILADVSMSLDNVLVVAGTARHHPWVLVFGLMLSVGLMGVAATLIAGMLRRYPWISYAGLMLIAWVALSMIWEGGHDAWRDMNGHEPHGRPPAEHVLPTPA
jgi:YjbE family integral membrane protein